MHTLPDRLGPNLRLLLVGINPSTYAVAHGHYFARKQNRFWPAFSASPLGQPICRALGVERLWPEHDLELPRFGIGLTDVVKIPSSNASFVTPPMFREGVERLRGVLQQVQAPVVCFHGTMAFRPFLQHGLGIRRQRIELGLQSETLEHSKLFVMPNPSGANAHFSLQDLIHWYTVLDQIVKT